MRSFAKSVQRLFSAEHLLLPGYPAKNTHHFPVPSAKVKVRKSPTSGGLGLEGECCLCCYATSQQKKSRRQTDAEMSSNYSANQYDSAFRSHRLQNWCETKCVNQRPTAHGGQTTFTSDNRGHLLPGVVKRGSAWPDFKGTWDLPARIPAHRINPTSRSVEGLDMLKCWGFDLQYTGTSQPHSKNKYPKNVGMQTNGDVRRDAAAMSSAAEARQPTQNLPIPGDRGPASQNHDPQAAVVRPIGEPDEEKPARQAAEPVQRNEEKLVLRHAAGEGTITGERRTSNVAE